MYRRGEVYYIHKNEAGAQESLRTKERTEAERLFSVKSEAHRAPIINLQIARAYLMISDPEAATRTWQAVMDEIVKLKRDGTLRRWLVAVKDKALDGIRNQAILETRAEHFLKAMEAGKVSTNIYLRRIHNFGLGMNWLPVPVIPKRMWPGLEFKDKGAITLERAQGGCRPRAESRTKAFYPLAWHPSRRLLRSETCPVLLPPRFVAHSLQTAAGMRLVRASRDGKIPAASCHLYFSPPTKWPWQAKTRDRLFAGAERTVFALQAE